MFSYRLRIIAVMIINNIYILRYYIDFGSRFLDAAPSLNTSGLDRAAEPEQNLRWRPAEKKNRTRALPRDDSQTRAVPPTFAQHQSLVIHTAYNNIIIYRGGGSRRRRARRVRNE